MGGFAATDSGASPDSQSCGGKPAAQPLDYLYAPLRLLFAMCSLCTHHWSAGKELHGRLLSTSTRAENEGSPIVCKLTTTDLRLLDSMDAASGRCKCEIHYNFDNPVPSHGWSFGHEVCPRAEPKPPVLWCFVVFMVGVLWCLWCFMVFGFWSPRYLRERYFRRLAGWSSNASTRFVWFCGGRRPLLPRSKFL